MSIQIFAYAGKHGSVNNRVVRDVILVLYSWFSQCGAKGNAVLFGIVYFAYKSEYTIQMQLLLHPYWGMRLGEQDAILTTVG